MPSISTVDLIRLRAIEQKMNEHRDNATVGPFVQLFIENVGLILANMPRSEWPTWANTAFNHAAGKYPLGASIFSQRSKP